MRSNRYRRFIEEHGFIHTLASVRPVGIYQQAMDRHWLRSVKEDYWQKELQHIGQQAVDEQEVYGDSPVNQIFGYQDRYDEYRRGKSTVAGEFRTTELNYWHLARDFDQTPTLDSDGS